MIQIDTQITSVASFSIVNSTQWDGLYSVIEQGHTPSSEFIFVHNIDKSEDGYYEMDMNQLGSYYTIGNQMDIEIVLPII
jgi:hypothetical protein